MKDLIIGVSIADIHFGAQEADVLYTELKENFLKVVKKLPRLDIVTVLGDTYDYKTSLDSEHSKFGTRFVCGDLPNLARETGCAVRIIKGTESHDGNQLNNYLYLSEEDDIDFKFYSKVDSEDFNGFKFLYIPEEYVDDKDKYYKEYFKGDKYDMIFGHGMFKETAFEQKSEVQMKKAPVFNSKDMIKMCYGPIMFGHIHTKTIIKNQIYYPGSFSRWVMGEERKKGFEIFIYNKKTHKYLVVPYYNNKARKFITIDIDPLLHYPIDVLLESIEDTIRDGMVDKLRIQSYDTNNDKYKEARLTILKEYFKGNKKIVLDIKTVKLIKEEKEKAEIVEKYGYLFDRGTKVEDKLARYIKEDLNYDIDSERVSEILYSNILDK